MWAGFKFCNQVIAQSQARFWPTLDANQREMIPLSPGTHVYMNFPLWYFGPLDPYSTDSGPHT